MALWSECWEVKRRRGTFKWGHTAGSLHCFSAVTEDPRTSREGTQARLKQVKRP